MRSNQLLATMMHAKDIMRYPLTEQKQKVRGFRTERGSFGADAEAPRLRPAGALAQSRIDDNGQSQQHQSADDVKCGQRINIDHKFIVLVTKNPRVHAPEVSTMPKRSESAENPIPVNTGTTMETKNTMPTLRNMSPINRVWLSDIIYSYHSRLQRHVKRMKMKVLRIFLPRNRKILATALACPHIKIIGVGACFAMAVLI